MVQMCEVNLLSAWKNIVSADGVVVDVNGSCIRPLNDVDATVESLRVTIARESIYLRSTTCF